MRTPSCPGHGHEGRRPCPSSAHTEGMSPPTRGGPRKLVLVGPPPSFEDALEALDGGRPDEAAALFAARVLADPTDWDSRINLVGALYDGERYAEAAQGYRKLIDEAEPRSLQAVYMCALLGYSLLQLGDDWGSLVATTAFLDNSNERHPYYTSALDYTACAWNNLGAVAEAATLWRTLELRAQPVTDATTRKLMRRTWSRRQVIATSHRILGLSAKPRPARRCSWPALDSWYSLPSWAR